MDEHEYLDRLGDIAVRLNLLAQDTRCRGKYVATDFHKINDEFDELHKGLNGLQINPEKFPRVAKHLQLK